MGGERWKKRGREAFHSLEEEDGWWMSEEREDGGVKDRFHLLWPHGLLPSDTGQTGDPQGPASEALSEVPTWDR
jgi:hypothetical protein